MGAYLYVKSKIFDWLEQKKIEQKYYWNKNFRLSDQALLKQYQRVNPFHVSKEYLLQKKQKEIHAYGETPLTTMETIARECGLSSEDIVIEMGAGRGRAALFLAEYIGCMVIAYEMIPLFVQRMVPSNKITMIEQDMFSIDFSSATAIYLYGTMLEEEKILELTEKFPKNVKIITVSYPLSDYSDQYQIKKMIPALFPWGKTEVYWNERA